MKKTFILSLCMLFVGLCACGEAISPKETVSSTTLQEKITQSTNISDVSTSAVTSNSQNESKQYSEAIKAIEKNFASNPNQLGNLVYALYDIDGNGTKELLIAESHPFGLCPFDIYTIQNGVAVLQDAFRPFGEGGSIHPSTLFKNGTIRYDFFGEIGDQGFGYYRFEDGVLKLQTTIKDDNGQYFHFNIYSQKYIPINKTEFDRLQKEFEGDGQVVELDWKPLAEYGR